MSGVVFVLGLVVVLVTVVSVLFTLVLPRQPAGIERMTLVVNRSVRLAFIGLSRLAKTYEGKDAVLAPTAPVALLAQLLFWAVAPGPRVRTDAVRRPSTPCPTGSCRR